MSAFSSCPWFYIFTQPVTAQYENRFASIDTRLGRLEALIESVNHRITLLMTVVFLVLGGVLSTLWVLARR